MNGINNHTSHQASGLPILYSLRNCPYAMRARIAIFKSQQTLLLRDIVLSDKPDEMLQASPKGTVPVVVLSNGKVIEESLEVMLWVLNESDPGDLLHKHSHRINAVHNDTVAENSLANMLIFIDEFDRGFKTALEQYKCAKRYKENNLAECRQLCEGYIQRLEEALNQHLYITSDQESLVDIALLPFIRQFARVERQWYLQSPYPKLKQWLNSYLQSPMFTKVMAKYPLWQESKERVLFGSSTK